MLGGAAAEQLCEFGLEGERRWMAVGALLALSPHLAEHPGENRVHMLGVIGEVEQRR